MAPPRVPEALLAASKLPDPVPVKPKVKRPTAPTDAYKSDSDDEDSMYRAAEEESAELRRRDAALDAYEELKEYMAARGAAVLDRCSFTDYLEFVEACLVSPRAEPA